MARQPNRRDWEHKPVVNEMALTKEEYDAGHRLQPIYDDDIELELPGYHEEHAIEKLMLELQAIAVTRYGRNPWDIKRGQGGSDHNAEGLGPFLKWCEYIGVTMQDIAEHIYLGSPKTVRNLISEAS